MQGVAVVRRGFRRALLAFSILALAARAAAADANAKPTLRLVWVRGERTETCADGPTIGRRVSARLGRRVFSDAADRSIEGVIQHEGEHWDAHIYVRDAGGKLSGSRELTAEALDCAPIEAAATLAIALAIDPDAALGLPPSAAAPAVDVSMADLPEASLPARVEPPKMTAPASPSPAASGSAPRPDVPPADAACRDAGAPPPAPPRLRDASLTLRPLVALGLLPTASLGVALSGEISASRWVRGTAGALVLPEVRTAARDFAFGLSAAWLGACAQPWEGRGWAIAACGKVYLGAIHAVVYALEPTDPGDRIWSGAALNVEARARLIGPLALEAGFEFVVPLTRQTFQVEGRPAAIFQEPAVAGLAFLGLGVTIP